ncbi:efflux RND transporter periplasmic adaptor subunit [Billgrantia endophytica]|uniref:Efflux RND transporter periplasmic adaptor subunit n=1 Tax=Billgrantia endophytica TaxID=2033802 RepID=A0A2N7TX08_9GAMM|nr:efflux RND transporter periplasmic adaptor subunit [Halomonas endophytica]PMR72719.1 efflux RND transporter periplasmic adaptor subunit [Halomonas endophytica]
MHPIYPLATALGVLLLVSPGGAEEPDSVALGFGEISCLVEPGRQATLSTQIPGVIAELLVRAGDDVEAGQELFRQAQDVERASMSLEGARAEYAGRRLQRNQRLIEQGMLSDSERDELDTELRLARMQVNLANAQLGQRSTTAPFSGLVTRLYAEEGEYIDATPVLDLVQLDPLRIEAVLPLTAYGRLAVGDTLGVRLHAPAERDVGADVERIDGVIDVSSGTFGVGLVLDNPEDDIPAGINCSLYWHG